MKYYFDSCIVIYLVEKISDYRSRIIDKIPNDSKIFISDLTKMECRVKPLQEKNLELLEEYDLFFNETVNEINLTSDVMLKATEIRARFNFKTPDSIHLACAVTSKVDYFVTNDLRLNLFKDIEIISLL
ncbi:MAG: type II toxin-antitoxin system VapC family toxin [Leptospiraceae bacterium]|nr:type II toxin-antitoxin system VapC family toxin [Leptospiraceae bacterium]